jgi:hypothetical protein
MRQPQPQGERSVADSDGLIALLVLLSLYVIFKGRMESALATGVEIILEQIGVFIGMADQLEKESPALGGLFAIATTASILHWLLGLFRS